jgi:hypothetical protein
MYSAQNSKLESCAKPRQTKGEQGLLNENEKNFRNSQELNQ